MNDRISFTHALAVAGFWWSDCTLLMNIHKLLGSHWKEAWFWPSSYGVLFMSSQWMTHVISMHRTLSLQKKHPNGRTSQHMRDCARLSGSMLKRDNSQNSQLTSSHSHLQLQGAKCSRPINMRTSTTMLGRLASAYYIHLYPNQVPVKDWGLLTLQAPLHLAADSYEALVSYLTEPATNDIGRVRAFYSWIAAQDPDAVTLYTDGVTPSQETPLYPLLVTLLKKWRKGYTYLLFHLCK